MKKIRAYLGALCLFASLPFLGYGWVNQKTARNWLFSWAANCDLNCAILPAISFAIGVFLLVLTVWSGVLATSDTSQKKS